MFIIKTHYVATEANKNFCGEEQTWYSGKKGHTLSKDEMPAQFWINLYGYTTKASAMRGLKAAKELDVWETKHGWWVRKSELVEVV